MSGFPEFVQCPRDAMIEAAKGMDISLKEKQEDHVVMSKRMKNYDDKDNHKK